MAALAKGLVGLSLAALVGCGATVRPGQRGLMYLALHDQGLQKEVVDDGFHFYWWPWNDVITYDVTWQSRIEEIEILTADVLHVAARVTVTFRPKQDELFRLQKEIGPDYYGKVVRPAFVTIARTAFAHHPHNGLARDGVAIEQQVLAELRGAVAGQPIEIARIAISHIAYDRGVTEAISQKLAIFQKVEQKESELQIAARDAEIARTAARGRADATRIEAEGQAAAIVLRGQAQARAQEEITKTLTPRYLQYKAFDGDSTRYYFVPVGKDGMPVIVNAEAGPGPMRDHMVSSRPPPRP